MTMVDPFLEFGMNYTTGESLGFRGHKAKFSLDTCERSCTNFDKMSSEERTNMKTEAPHEYEGFKHYCGEAGVSDDMKTDQTGLSTDQRKQFMEKRGTASENPSSEAPEGAFYWWAGRKQYFPNVAYQAHALAYAQTSYFISIIVVQWADLLIAKTRKLSVFDQGLSNGFMNFGIAFETILGCFLIYVPVFNMVFGTRPLHILHWFPGVPWSILILLYDETRKHFMRQNPGGWLERFTYW